MAADKNGFVIENGVLVKYTGSEECVIIPDGVHKIGDAAFAYRDFLREVDMTDEVKIIGKMAFAFCPKLETVSMSRTVEEIGELAFAQSLKWKCIIINESAHIADSAFGETTVVARM